MFSLKAFEEKIMLWNYTQTVHLNYIAFIERERERERERDKEKNTNLLTLPDVNSATECLFIMPACRKSKEPAN